VNHIILKIIMFLLAKLKWSDPHCIGITWNIFSEVNHLEIYCSGNWKKKDLK